MLFGILSIKDAILKCNFEFKNNKKKRGENMSEKEQKIIKSISDALPKMSDFDKGYFLGAAEQMVSEKEKKGTTKIIQEPEEEVR